MKENIHHAETLSLQDMSPNFTTLVPTIPTNPEISQVTNLFNYFMLIMRNLHSLTELRHHSIALAYAHVKTYLSQFESRPGRQGTGNCTW